jgi:ABC-2 type transport system ATP-binding protein
MKPIEVDDIIKNYGSEKDTVNALKGISFNVGEGELFGMIGPDGAGKTSLFRILATLLLADSGTATINGFDCIKDYKAIRNTVGYMPGRFSLYPDLTIEENLAFFATIFNTSIAENYSLIRDIYIQIEPFRKRRAGKLSGGMKQKLALCCALIHRPSVLLLDEPTTGVDAVSRKEFWEMLKGLKQQGIAILVSTPYMDEAGLCDRIGLIQNGSLLSVNTPQGVIAEFKNNVLAVKAPDMLKLLNKLKSSDLVKDAYSFGEFHHAVMQPDQNNEERLRQLLESDQSQTVIKHTLPGIEDCFLALMKN